ncbi:hypothetical protein C2G38_2087673 [Gigaspora rosea]|uniref:Uncharacterized protein n=1 Tax=Gigaspora rosea TaxID=44941 RepID=A0A397V8Q1_9GLOM|nr:hypothetical protein C2G38_2087673 [Gigaspora rosea]
MSKFASMYLIFCQLSFLGYSKSSPNQASPNILVSFICSFSLLTKSLQLFIILLFLVEIFEFLNSCLKCITRFVRHMHQSKKGDHISIVLHLYLVIYLLFPFT